MATHDPTIINKQKISRFGSVSGQNLKVKEFHQNLQTKTERTEAASGGVLRWYFWRVPRLSEPVPAFGSCL